MTRRRFAALAFALPAALFVVHRGLGHEGDLAFFHEWYLAFREGPGFYRDGPGVNYPIVGTLLVCGPAWLVEQALGAPLDLWTFRLVHKLVLVLGEVGLIFAAARLAQTLGATRPRRLALLVYALPSTWAGGAWFGQVDVYGTLALLLAASELMRFAQASERPTPRPLFVGALALAAAFWLKQLTWFSMPALGALLLVGLYRHRASRLLGLAPLALLLAPLLVDPWLGLPSGHASHLSHIIARSSGDHGVLVVANGASVWIVAPEGLGAGDSIGLGLTPVLVGWLAWASAQLLFVWQRIGRQWTGRQWTGRRRIVARELVRLAGFAQLAMATLMTGVHERYLAHAIPLLVLADHDGPTWRRALGFAVAVLGGLFVLASIHGELSPLAPAWLLAPLSLAWLLSYLVPEGPGRSANVSPAPAPEAEADG